MSLSFIALDLVLHLAAEGGCANGRFTMFQ
ncbi:MAG: hypothetical protein JWO52_5553, partial [Gammaproteobacteria bacterium]|nr:hypothetical protein [Gammaproteobacteria bacterium]MDB6105554.1 hypothetical protein [Gammaproteobacteria bacterium]